MTKTWVIADTHFFHTKLITLCGRHKDFTDRIIESWHKQVQPDDIVYHLGDVGFYAGGDQKRRLYKVLQSLPGHKILIRGNHDRLPIAWYLNCFMAVMESAVVDVMYTTGCRHPRNYYFKVLLSHTPQPIPEGVDVNLHGHFHNNESYHWEEPMVNLLTPEHRLLTIEELGYKLVPLGWAIYHDVFTNSYLRAQEVRNK